MSYKPRLQVPSINNRYYNSNINPYVSAGYGMFQNGGNCTCYAFGRAYENLKSYPKLSTGNAKDFYPKKDGYARGQKPELGAIACWSGGSRGYGHVAVVEEIKSDGTIITSNSGWRSSLFYTKKITPPYNQNGYTFQGFIYVLGNGSGESYDGGSTYTGTFPTLPKRGYFNKWDTGEQVKNVQRFLNWAINSKLVIDGSYGNKTCEAVKKFQKKVGLYQDGSFGKDTLAKAKTFKK